MSARACSTSSWTSTGWIRHRSELADAIVAQSERALREQISAVAGRCLPELASRSRAPTTWPLTLAVQHHRWRVMRCMADLRGHQRAAIASTAINVPLCYTRAMACYAIKCLAAPRIPNNEGSVRPGET
jgi:N-methylhydantoinase B